MTSDELRTDAIRPNFSEYLGTGGGDLEGGELAFLLSLIFLDSIHQFRMD